MAGLPSAPTASTIAIRCPIDTPKNQKPQLRLPAAMSAAMNTLTTAAPTRAGILGAARSLRAPTAARMAPLRRRVAAPIRAAAAAGKDDVQGEMLSPSIANNPIVRTAALAATVAGAAYSTAFLPTAAVGFVHMLVFGSWFGTLAWTSFIFGVVAFRNLPRQTFGRLQSKLFPKYFAVSSAAPALLLATLRFIAPTAPAKEITLLVIALVASLVNLLVTEPLATKIMFQRYELENAEGARDEAAIKALTKKFGAFHGISSLLNLAVLVCAVGHAYYLGAFLHV